MDKQEIAVLIPIIVSLGAFLMVFGLRYLQNKENMSMIERGINPADAKRRLEIDPSRTLKNGMMFVGA
ncbi:MAG: hypothetical protein IT269_03975, partial [Saprospiraceae bacterium]|nr:hypothetical protein [Saprospiraceae bacterium]